MKRRLSIIIIAFCISFGLMVALSLFSMERFTMFTNYSNQVNHTGAVIISIRSAEVGLRDIGLTERGYMITEDTMYLNRLNVAIDSINKTIAEIKEMTTDNPEQQKNIALLKGSVAMKIAAVRDNVAYVDSSHSSSRSKFYDTSRSIMRECAERMNAMRAVENKLLTERTREQHFYQKLTNATLKYLLFVFCVITLILFVIMVKELQSRMLYQEELQAKVIDLRRSHSELREIAYATSHDLQEPLRKIQVFCDMLLHQRDGKEEDRKATLARINNSANRMHLLLTDLMSLTNLTEIDELKTHVDLNKIIRIVLIELQDRIGEKGASIDVQEMPTITGYDNQLKILFKALLDNSLKFTREGVKPVVTISCDIMIGHELSGINPNLLHKKFYRITCSDNGIGFENQFIGKMFQIFQRLHTQESEYAGKGIGLAICQRIMANHEGYIIAHGEPQMGAKFKLFFPVEG
jgi:signal transduction histidine kinase